MRERTKDFALGIVVGGILGMFVALLPSWLRYNCAAQYQARGEWASWSADVCETAFTSSKAWRYK